MKVIQAPNLLFIATCVYTSAAAQCTGKDGFFTETSTYPSYLVVHGGMTQSNWGGGWLSSLQGNSKINWTTEGATAFVMHPGPYSCILCSDYHLAPTGTTSACGSAANALYNTVLSSPC